VFACESCGEAPRSTRRDLSTRSLRSIDGEPLRSIPAESPCCGPRRCNSNSDKHGTERCAFEDALVLLDLQTGRVGLTLDAKKCCARDGQPGAEEDFVTVLLHRGLRDVTRHDTDAVGQKQRWKKR